jgi:hypothetical protein
MVKIAQRNDAIMATRQAADAGSEGGAMMNLDGLLAADETRHLRHAIHMTSLFGGGWLLHR